MKENNKFKLISWRAYKKRVPRIFKTIHFELFNRGYTKYYDVMDPDHCVNAGQTPQQVALLIAKEIAESKPIDPADNHIVWHTVTHGGELRVVLYYKFKGHESAAPAPASGCLLSANQHLDRSDV